MHHRNKEELINPSKVFFDLHKKDILNVRATLFKSLKGISPAIRNGVEEILNSKIKSSSRHNVPLMFELFPWILSDLSNIDKKTTRYIAVNWLSIYLYVIFLDDHLDLKTEIRAEEFIGSSLLSQKGLINLFKIVHGTRFEKIFTDSLSISANYQLMDVVEQTALSSDKSVSARGKNRILIICAGAIAATNKKNSQFVISLTNSLLLAIQFLDDLADFENDYKVQNITVLLNNVAKNSDIRRENVDRRMLLEELIYTGSLLSVISKIEESLSVSIALINKKKIANTGSNPSYIFFTNMYLELLALKEVLEKECLDFKNRSTNQKNIILDKVENSIQKIYLHT